MAYSKEEINQLKNQLLEVSRSASPDWSAVDDAIYNSFWESNKDKPEVVLNFPIAGQAQAPDEQRKSESREDSSAESGGSSPFAVENGVVTYRGKPTSELSEEERRNLFGSIGGDILNDPQFRRTVQVGHGDMGFVEEEQPDPELVQRLYRDGRWYQQVGALRSVGGEGEVSDPSKITWDEELGWITPMSNVREFSDSVFTPGMLLLAGGMLGAVGLAGGFSGLGSALGFGEAAAGTGATTGATTGGIVSGATEAALTGTGAGSAGAGVGAGIGSGGLEVSEAMRNILAQGTAAGGSAASTAANAAIQQGVQTLGGIGGGGWFSNLSPMAQRAITSAVSQGASAIMAGRRQESAQDFARQQYERQLADRRQEEERARLERERRGTPQQFTFNVNPRSGIVGSSMGG